MINCVPYMTTQPFQDPRVDHTPRGPKGLPSFEGVQNVKPYTSRPFNKFESSGEEVALPRLATRVLDDSFARCVLRCGPTQNVQQTSTAYRNKTERFAPFAIPQSFGRSVIQRRTRTGMETTITKESHFFKSSL